MSSQCLLVNCVRTLTIPLRHWGSTKYFCIGFQKRLQNDTFPDCGILFPHKTLFSKSSRNLYTTSEIIQIIWFHQHWGMNASYATRPVNGFIKQWINDHKNNRNGYKRKCLSKYLILIYPLDRAVRRLNNWDQGSFNKTFTPAIYKCSHCFRVWKQ